MTNEKSAIELPITVTADITTGLSSASNAARTLVAMT